VLVTAKGGVNNESRVWTRSGGGGVGSYMLNTRHEENNTVFYSYSACLVNTLTLNMYAFMS